MNTAADTFQVTAKMAALHAELLTGVESTQTDKEGREWGSVYLPNHRVNAGVLANLTLRGLYKRYDGGEAMYVNVWGYVRMGVTVAARP